MSIGNTIVPKKNNTIEEWLIPNFGSIVISIRNGVAIRISHDICPNGTVEIAVRLLLLGLVLA